MPRARIVKTLKTRNGNALEETLVVSQPTPDRLDGVLVGTFVAVDADGTLRVDLPYPGFVQPVSARTTVPLDARAVGREVAVVFEGGRIDRPLVIGMLHSARAASSVTPSCDVGLDGERLVLTAEHEIVLRCGKATITLTRAGKILIRGEYLLSRATGANRIKGGSIQLN